MSHTALPSARPMRIAHVIQNLNYGGMERVLHCLAAELPNRGFEVHVVVLEYLGHFAGGLGERVGIHQAPAMSKLSLLRPRGLATLLEGIAPDVVHSHTGVWLKAVSAARLAQVPKTVHTEHGRPVPDRRSDRLIDGLASRRTDAIVAVSAPLARFLADRIVRDPSRIRVIANGVDVSRLQPSTDRDALRSSLGLPPDALIIGSVGRLEPVKNYGLAIQALARLGEATGLQPMLVLAGDGIERAALEELARSLGLSSRVKFLGWREDADQLYSAFDLFTLTSRSEGTSISLLEAMSSGACPVVTDVGGNRNVLGASLGDLLVPDNDAAALTAAWRRCLEDSGLRAERGRLARERVVECFSLSRMVDQHIALYQDLFRNGPGRQPSPPTTRASDQK